MAEQKKQGDLIKVSQLRPSNFGLNLKVKVASSKLIDQSGRAQGRFAECLVGDETGIVVFTARNDQVDIMREGTTVLLTNAKVDLYKGSMRLALDRYGRVEVTTDADFSMQADYNLSLIEFERIVVMV